MDTITIIVFVFLAVIISIILYYSFTKTDNKIDPNPSHKCVGDGCKKEIDCGVLSSTTIKTCDPKDLNSICNTCICSGTTNLTGCMVCTEVNDDHPYHVDITKDQCTDPFFWDNGMCKLKDGHYCLPKVVNDIICPSTGRKLLVDTSIGYDWKCICKNDTQFTGPTCSDIKICGMLGANADTDNPTPYNRGLVNNKGVHWTSQSSWDPLTDGVCTCGPNEIPDNVNHICLPNSCNPGSIGTTKEDCNCPPTYINCNSIATVADSNPLLPSYYSGVCKIPSCIPDPCGGQDGNAGHYDIATRQCICNDGYHSFTDPSNVVGQSCQKVCENNGICGNGETMRGTCYYYDNNNQVKVFTIACGGNTTGMCTKNESVIYFTNAKTSSYLNYKPDGDNLNLYIGSTGGEFIFEIHCDNTDPNNKCPPDGTNALSFQINVQYYLKIGNKYVDLVGGTFTTDKSKSLVRFLNKSDPGQMKAPLINTQIFIVSTNSYLSVDNNGNIIFPKNYSNSERCKDCINGWTQDSQDLCNNQCVLDGKECHYGGSPCCNPNLSCKSSYFGNQSYCS